MNYLSTSRFLLAGLGLTVLLAACGGGGGSDRSSDKKKVDFEGECQGGKIVIAGESPIFTGIDVARGKAKDDACRNAIYRCIGEQVASVGQVSDGQAVTQEIFSSAQGICKSEQILDEKQYKLDTVTMLKATFRFNVKKEDIQSRIDTAQKLVGNPKIMVLIREEITIAGQAKKVRAFAARDGIAGASLRDFLVRKGYTVIDSAKAGVAGGSEEMYAEDPSKLPDDVKNRAAEAGADVLIIGNLEVNPQKIQALKGTDFKSYTATGNISVMTLWGKGKILMEYNKPGNGAGTTHEKASDESLRRFAIGSEDDPIKKPAALAKDLHRRLADEWGHLTRNNVIVMKIKGLDNKTAGLFRDDLKERTGVKEVNPLKENENDAEWEVTFPGRSFALAETLNFYKDRPDVFVSMKELMKAGKKGKFNVKSANRGEIVMEFE